MLPLLLAALALPVAPREFRVDAGHSRVEFSVGFLYSDVRGRFDDMRGALLFDEADPTRSSVMVVIEARSISTGSAHRDEHLRSADFLDVERFPRITFEGRRVERRGGGLVVAGDLTLHGVTRPVTIPFRALHAPARDPHGSTIVNFAGQLTIARADFGITGGSRFNPWFDALRSATMADSVHIALELEGWDGDFDRLHDAEADSAMAKIAREGVAAVTARIRAAAAAKPGTFDDAWWEFNQIGRFLLARGRGADAVEVMKLNAELHPDRAELLASLAAAYRTLGDSAASVATYERALAQDPNEPRARLWLRRLKR